MNKTLACIISYNGRNFLPQSINSCLPSNIDILVIDNNSKDGSLEYIKSLNPITLIKNEENSGFTKAVNQAIEYSSNHNYKYILLLNQDTEFGPDMVSLLLRSFEENPSLAIVSPMQLNELNQPEYQFQINCNDFGIEINTPQIKTLEVPFVNAACWLMDLKKIKEIGYLYSIFKNYGSDLNYCNRVIHSGYKVGINLEANVVHKKKDNDYENSLSKTIKIHNTYYLALILNPNTNITVQLILSSLYKGLIASILKFNFKKALLNKLTAIFLLLRLSDIRKIKATIQKPK